MVLRSDHHWSWRWHKPGWAGWLATSLRNSVLLSMMSLVVDVKSRITVTSCALIFRLMVLWRELKYVTERPVRVSEKVYKHPPQG